MKRFFQITGIVASVLCGIGLILVCIGLLGGGFNSVKKAALSNELTWNWQPKWIKNYTYQYKDYEDVLKNEFDINLTDFFSDGYEKYSDGTYEFPLEENTKNIEITVGGGTLSVHSTDSEQISIEVSNGGKMQCYQKNGTLYIKGGHKTNFQGSSMVLYLPENLNIEDYTVELGAGELDLDAFSCEKALFQIGAGTINIEKMDAADMTVELGAGDMTVQDMDIETLQCSIGMGEADLSGKIAGDTTIECAMGSVDLTVAGKEDDFNYSIDCAMGDVEIGTIFGGAVSEQYIDHNADKEMKLECAMGSITVNFQR